MFNSTVLDVAIGLIFAFLAVSLVASVVVEAISSAMKWRSGHLLEGIKQLVNDPEFKGLALQLYQHAAVNPRGIPPAAAGAAVPPAGAAVPPVGWLGRIVFEASRPSSGTAVDLRSSPAYVDGLQFAGALMDILKLSTAGASVPPAQSTPTDAMKAALQDLLNPAKVDGNDPIQANPQLHQLLSGIVERSRGDIAQVQKQIAAWFDNGMDRLSGAYKRRTQLVAFIVALVVAVVVNVDAIQIGHVLWSQPTLAADLKLPDGVAAALAQERSPAGDGTGAPSALVGAAAGALTMLDRHLPVGWQPGQEGPASAWEWIAKLLGWLVTAGATLFGAPFWFDTLQAVIRLKGSGPSPDDKSEDRAAA